MPLEAVPNNTYDPINVMPFDRDPDFLVPPSMANGPAIPHEEWDF